MFTWSSIKNNFNLNGIPEVYFWKSQFENFNPANFETPVSYSYIVYRFFYLVWFVSSLVVYFSCPTAGDEFYLIYMTNQTICLQLVYSAIYFIYIVKKKTTKASDPVQSDTNVPRLYKLSLIPKLLWILKNIVHIVPIVVSIMYWGLLSQDRDTFEKPCRFVRNHFIHSFNSVAAILDSIVVSIQVRITHSIFPITFAALFLVFSAVYEIAGGPLPGNDTSIYKIMEWSSETSSSRALCTAIWAMIGGFVLFLAISVAIYQLKLLMNTYLNIGPKPEPITHQPFQNPPEEEEQEEPDIPVTDENGQVMQAIPMEILS